MLISNIKNFNFFLMKIERKIGRKENLEDNKNRFQHDELILYVYSNSSCLFGYVYYIRTVLKI